MGTYTVVQRSICEGLDASIDEQNIVLDLALMIPPAAKEVRAIKPPS